MVVPFNHLHQLIQIKILVRCFARLSTTDLSQSSLMIFFLFAESLNLLFCWSNAASIYSGVKLFLYSTMVTIFHTFKCTSYPP